MPSLGEATVEVRPDTKGFGSKLGRDVDKATSKAGKKAGRGFGSSLLVGAGAAGVVGVAVAGATKVVTGFVSAAIQAEKETTRAAAGFERLGIGPKKAAKAMADAGKSATKLGFDDETAAQSLTVLTRAGGSLAAGQKGLASAFDVARAKGVSLEAATKTVSLAQLGNSRALKQLGIEVPKVTTAQDKLKAKVKDLQKQAREGDADDKARIRNQIDQVKAFTARAKQADKEATAKAALAAIDSKLGNQAEAYAKTSAGALATLGERWNNFQEDVGSALLPVVSTLGNAAADGLGTFADASVVAIDRAKQVLVPFAQDMVDRFGPQAKQAFDDFKTGAGEAFAELGPKVSTAAAAIGPVFQEALAGMAPGAAATFATVKEVIGQNLQSAVSIVSSILTGLSNAWGRWGNEIKATVKVVFDQLVIIIRTSLQVVSAIFAAIAAVLRGDWDEAWAQLKTAARAALAGVVATIKNLGPALLGALKAIAAQAQQTAGDLGRAILRGAKAELKALPGQIKEAVGLAFRGWGALVGIALNAAVKVGTAVVKGAVQGLKFLGAQMLALVSLALNGVAALAGFAFNLVVSVGTAIIDGMVSGVRAAAGKLASAAVDAVTGAFNAAKEKIGFGSPARAYIPLGVAMMQGIGVGIKQWAPNLKDELSTTMRDVIESARNNVADKAGELADILGQTLDKSKRPDRADAVLGPKTTAENAVDTAQAALDAQNQADKIEQLRKATMDFKATQADRNKAALELQIALNEQQAKLDAERRQKEFEDAQQGVEDLRKADEQKITDAKAALQQQVADLTDAFNRKTKEEDGSIITSQEYIERLQKLLHDAVPNFGDIGTELGSAVANQFQDSLALIATQLSAITDSMAGVQAGEVIDPVQVAQAAGKIGARKKRVATEKAQVAKAEKALDRAIDASKDAKGPGGSDVTDAEKKAIHDAQVNVNTQKAQLTTQERMLAELERIVGGGGTVTVTTIMR